MKKLTLYILMIAFLTNCATLGGREMDAQIKKNKEKLPQMVHEENQPIVMETVYGEQISTRFLKFVYNPGSTEGKSTRANFPKIGDTLKVFRVDSLPIDGIFKGISKKYWEYRLMLAESGTEEIQHLAFDSIRLIRCTSKDIKIKNPNPEMISLVYDNSGYQFDIPLSQLQHLNSKEIRKGRYAFTTMGVFVDVLLTTFFLVQLNEPWFESGN